MSHLVKIAHRQGVLHSDVTADDFVPVLSLMPGDGISPAAPRRWVRLFLRGLLTG
ncbi:MULTISPECIES: hypothetical protein [Frankia]|uniref:hypothetical protein n=1 Tax=Frankia TaxID=1854 RepID=UPI0012FF1435|nr:MULTISPECIES: hypothetical protein [Frankia]